MLLNKSQIKQVEDFRSEEVDVSEWWGGSVKVRSMSAKDRISFEAEQSEQKPYMHMVISLIMHTCIDEEGNKLFEDADREILENKSPEALIKIFKTTVELNTLNHDSIEKEAKNS